MSTPEVDNVLLNGVKNAASVGSLNLGGHARRLKFFVLWGDSSNGAVQIEEAYIAQGPDKTVNTYTGTWAPIGSAFTSPTNTPQQQTLTVVQQPFSTVRARVTTTVDGTTGVTVRVLGN